MSIVGAALGGSRLGGAVYDRGYRPYAGPRGGRRAATLALWRLSVRRALGLRRSWRQKVFPWTLLGIVTIPAIVNVGVGFASQDVINSDFTFITYREYVGVSTALLLFVALVAPDIVCPDRRDRVLPLLFSRQITGNDYVLAKVTALTAILFGFTFLPQVVLFVGQMLVSDDGALNYLTDNADVLWKVPISAALLAIYYAVVALALACLTDRKIVGGVALLGLALITSTIAAVFVAANDGEGTLAAVTNLLALPLALRDVVFLGHVTEDTAMDGAAGAGALAVVVYSTMIATGLAVLVRRYRGPQL